MILCQGSARAPYPRLGLPASSSRFSLYFYTIVFYLETRSLDRRLYRRVLSRFCRFLYREFSSYVDFPCFEFFRNTAIRKGLNVKTLSLFWQIIRYVLFSVFSYKKSQFTIFLKASSSLLYYDFLISVIKQNTETKTLHCLKYLL